MFESDSAETCGGKFPHTLIYSLFRTLLQVQYNRIVWGDKLPPKYEGGGKISLQ